MNVLIVEDEKIAADKLENMLTDCDPEIHITAKLGSVKSAVKWLTANTPDVIFLDIQLSDGLSFSIFDYVTVQTPIIFTTAYDQYAIKAFEVNSIAYLLKPIRKEQLEEALKKLQSLQSAFAIDFDSLLKQLQGKESPYKKRFLIQIGEKIRKVETDDAAYFFVMDKNVFIKTFGGSTYPIDYSLDKLESVLNPQKFFRINRKFIVNIEAITDMTAYSRSRVKVALKPKPDNPDETIVSVERSAGFKEWLNK
jgi:DNA-binding LytR/AlgR family response regulator